jgi:hypothetical protein
MIATIEGEIQKLKELIDKLKGVGCYQSHCEKWALYIEAYEILKGRMLDERSPL